ncbi:hypothetical protein Gotri_006323 [Gossypium trilobum]|nr:hypothetical protein [Gossypium trilobum]
MSNIGRGCKLDPKLINMFIERWRPEMHTFHLPCGECTSVWSKCSYNKDCWWTGSYSPGSFNLLIGEPYAMIF